MASCALQVFYAQAPLILFEARGSLTGLAAIRISEGLLNLLLSLILGWYYGINGVATATLISGVLIGLGITPYYSSRALKVSFGQYLIQTLSYSLVCIVVLSVVYGGLSWHFGRPTSYLMIACHCAIGTFSAVTSWWLIASPCDRKMIMNRISRGQIGDSPLGE
jgi:O-antigen/teichoic acid export membrane protein